MTAVRWCSSHGTLRDACRECGLGHCARCTGGFRGSVATAELGVIETSCLGVFAELVGGSARTALRRAAAWTPAERAAALTTVLSGPRAAPWLPEGPEGLEGSA